MNLLFDEFQQINIVRCNEVFHRETAWTPQDWALAIAGEVGEACNILKKVKRGDLTLEQARPAVLSELADVITYVDLLMTCLGANTGEELMKKFQEVSARYNYESGNPGA